MVGSTGEGGPPHRQLKKLALHIDEPSTWWWPKAAAAKIMADPRHEPRPGGLTVEPFGAPKPVEHAKAR